MQIDTISYHDLNQAINSEKHQAILHALLNKGIIGVTDVPEFMDKSRAYVEAARAFTHLPENIKNQYAPDRDAGETEGYELGAESFMNDQGEWQQDDKKSSYYAYYPDKKENRWPKEVDLKTAYLDLAAIIFEAGKRFLKMLNLDEEVGIYEKDLIGHCRMLHYLKENDATNQNPDWCGAHHDHSLLTGLMPAYYFQNGQEIAEPSEAGLFITPYGTNELVKIEANQSTLLFQIGEFGQLISNDKAVATRHIVKKTLNGVERYAFALFYNLQKNYIAKTSSVLRNDARFQEYKAGDDLISYGEWSRASFARYRVL